VSVSRRELLFGRLFGEPEEPAPKDAFYPTAEVNDLLARARRRAPWEQSSVSPASEGHKARILVFECLAWRGSSCMSCHERCPVPGALTLDDQMRPTVQVDACTGCGDCVASCPSPSLAIAVGPEAT
jgi:Na+-translocating ferredoxin:NAD+ oxidoreductase RNF subunit RnfB